MTALRALVSFAALLFIPGWTLLALTGLARRWSGLTRWLMVLTLSLALFPVGFYVHRALLSWVPLGPYKLSALLALAAGWTAWRLRGTWRELLRFDVLEWLAVLAFAATLFTRFWIIRGYPYPAWSDSLHHTLLTQLTAEQGHLPWTLGPYESTPLAMYHLGLYGLSASVQWLAGVPAHTALLWTAQVLNGLCGVGIYLLLERRVGRLAALVGVVVAGLLSHQPSYYVNWGRFTQLAGQTVLLGAAQVTWEALTAWRTASARRERLALAGMAALLSAAVFLYHFRVAAFYLPLLALIFVAEGWTALRERQGKRLFAGVALIAGLGLLLVSPALWEALRVYVTRATTPVEAQFSADVNTYFTFPLRAIPIMGLHPPLLWAAGLAALVGLWRRQGLTVLVLVWTGLLMALGYAYLLPWRVLHVTNLGAVVIMLYLPAALLMGVGAQALASAFDARRHFWGTGLILGVLLVSVVQLGAPRLREIEVARHFVTPADVAAMEWIRVNTPPEALFAINTYPWFPTIPHGVDGGYWIPYFTQRRITAGTMIGNLGPWEETRKRAEIAQNLCHLSEKPEIVNVLVDYGVDYLYLGARTYQAPCVLDLEMLLNNPFLNLVYQKDGVFIFALESF